MELAPISALPVDFEPPPMAHELVARELAPPAYVDAVQRHARTPRAACHPLLEHIAIDRRAEERP